MPKKVSLGQIWDKKSLKSIKIQVKIVELATKRQKLPACGAKTRGFLWRGGGVCLKILTDFDQQNIRHNRCFGP